MMMRKEKLPEARGFTLVELMVSLSIFSLMSTAIISMMFGAYNTSTNVRAKTDLVTQVESAMRRIIDNTRSASTLGPNFTATHLDEFSQPDPDNANIKYDIQYYVNNQGQLKEQTNASTTAPFLTAPTF